MDDKPTYTKISDRDFMKLLDNALKDANSFCEKLQQEKNNLIKYLEDRINYMQELINCKNGKVKPYGEELHIYEISLNIYKDILERVKSGKYDNR